MLRPKAEVMDYRPTAVPLKQHFSSAVIPVRRLRTARLNKCRQTKPIPRAQQVCDGRHKKGPQIDFAGCTPGRHFQIKPILFSRAFRSADSSFLRWSLRCVETHHPSL
jgi:hypothetical protein